MVDEKSIEKYIKSQLSPKRLEHTYAVSIQAREMCELLGRSDLSKKAEIAGLLHDITKELDTDSHIEIIKNSDIVLTKDDIQSPNILHAFSGAVKARELFPDFVDDDIYKAIFNHSTGRENMTFLEKVIFLSDYIEPTRTYYECRALYEYFIQRTSDGDILDSSCLICMSNTINYLARKGLHINTRTLLARNYLLNKEKI